MREYLSETVYLILNLIFKNCTAQQKFWYYLLLKILFPQQNNIGCLKTMYKYIF